MAALVPRRFKIDHAVNEYVFSVVWLQTKEGERWAIELGNTGMYMRSDRLYDYLGHASALFDTAQAALEFWKEVYER